MVLLLTRLERRPRELSPPRDAFCAVAAEIAVRLLIVRAVDEDAYRAWRDRFVAAMGGRTAAARALADEAAEASAAMLALADALDAVIENAVREALVAVRRGGRP